MALNGKEQLNGQIQDEEEVFEDATDETCDQITSNPPSLEEAIQEVVRCLDLALNNQFEEALEITEKWAHISLYHALGKACLSFLKGVLTLERDEIQRAMNALKEVLELCTRNRKQSNSMTKVVWKPNYNNYTDDEIHAELCYAESLLMIALLTFLEDQNLVNLVKGAFRIRSCYQSYKECNYILNSRTNWKSESVRRHFESGVRMGFGTFNLMISHLPGKVLKLLEFVGFSGNRLTGFKELEISTQITEGLRSPLAALIMMAYHCYVEHLFGLGEGDLDCVGRLLKKFLGKYPTSAFFLLFAGRLSQLRGDLDEAIEHFNNCINIQNQWKQLHNICYWELLWCHAIQCQWERAAGYADILRKQCNWSPATYTYEYGVFLYMLYDEENRPELKQEVNEMMKKVPSLRIRYAGKTVPAEKFAITHSEKYFNQGEALLLPALEFMYIWNILAIAENAKHLVEPLMDRIEKKLKIFKHEKELTDHPMDNYALLMLLKGILLRTLGFPLQAEECFLEILKNEKRIQVSTFLTPHAAMELGLAHIKLKEYSSARQWLESARRDYTGYLLETMVHFRVHCAIRTIKQNEKKKEKNGNNNEAINKAATSAGDSPPLTPEDELPVKSVQGHVKKSAFLELKRKFQTSKSCGTGKAPMTEYEDFLDSYQTKL